MVITHTVRLLSSWMRCCHLVGRHRHLTTCFTELLWGCGSWLGTCLYLSDETATSYLSVPVYCEDAAVTWFLFVPVYCEDDTVTWYCLYLSTVRMTQWLVPVCTCLLWGWHSGLVPVRTCLPTYTVAHNVTLTKMSQTKLWFMWDKDSPVPNEASHQSMCDKAKA